MINTTGDLVLGTDADDASNEVESGRHALRAKTGGWLLTIRAAGNLEFKNALSDGFAGDFLAQ
jgi:hypothetical protein